MYLIHTKVCYNNKLNESTAGADASVEVPKLYNIKLLYNTFIHMHIIYHDEHICALINFAACRQNSESQGNSKSG